MGCTPTFILRTPQSVTNAKDFCGSDYSMTTSAQLFTIVTMATLSLAIKYIQRADFECCPLNHCKEDHLPWTLAPSRCAYRLRTESRGAPPPCLDPEEERRNPLPLNRGVKKDKWMETEPGFRGPVTPPPADLAQTQ